MFQTSSDLFPGRPSSIYVSHQQSNNMTSDPPSAPTNHPSAQYLLSELITILHGLVGGMRYGAKIRLPHAAVMALVFKRHESLNNNLKLILQLALEHAKALGSFAAIYKALLLAFKVISFRRRIESHDPRKTGYPDKPFHALVAGAAGGYFVWGNYSSINNQILLYISSRVCVGLFKLWTEKKTDKGINEIQESITPKRFDWYPYMSAVVWGTVMYLFEEFPHVLQPSLKASMEEIYRFIL